MVLNKDSWCLRSPSSIGIFIGRVPMSESVDVPGPSIGWTHLGGCVLLPPTTVLMVVEVDLPQGKLRQLCCSPGTWRREVKSDQIWYKREGSQRSSKRSKGRVFCRQNINPVEMVVVQETPHVWSPLSTLHSGGEEGRVWDRTSNLFRPSSGTPKPHGQMEGRTLRTL